MINMQDSNLLNKYKIPKIAPAKLDATYKIVHSKLFGEYIPILSFFYSPKLIRLDATYYPFSYKSL